MVANATRLKYRRKEGSGELIIARGKTLREKQRNRQVYAPGDPIIVKTIEELPGYPHQIDGWEFIGAVAVDGEFDGTVSQAEANPAKLEAVHQGRGKWKVVIKQPGHDYLDKSTGKPVAKGVMVHSRWLNRETAERWVELGYDPAPEDESSYNQR